MSKHVVGGTFNHEKFQDLLEEQGVTQTDMALRLGVSQPYVNQLARGRRNPSLDLLRRLSAELGVTMEELLFEVTQ